MTKLIDNEYNTSFETIETDPVRIFNATRDYFLNEGYMFEEEDMPHRLKFKYKMSRLQRFGASINFLPLSTAHLTLSVLVSIPTIKFDYHFPDKMIMTQDYKDAIEKEVNRLKVLLDSHQNHIPPPPPPSSTPDVCKACGKEVNPDFKVCPYCEQPLASETPTCPGCGKEVSPEFKVCPYCEHRLETSDRG